jgi:hypothetical protein
VVDRLTGRVGGWVLAQFALMALIGVMAFLPPAWPEGAQRELRAVGLVLVVAGLGLAIAARYAGYAAYARAVRFRVAPGIY